MRIIYVDDEKNAHVNFHYDTRNRQDIQSLEFFISSREALEYAKTHQINVAFLDINMPELDGITLAKKLKEIHPKLEVIFITGYQQFAYEAFRVGGRAYLPKPYSEEELEGVFSILNKLIDRNELQENDGNGEGMYPVFFKTFGNFDLFLDGTPAYFKNAKAKELLALLVNAKGSSVSSMEIFDKLWENKMYNKSTSTYVRRTIRSLKDQMEEYGIGGLLISERNMLSIDARCVQCDYYEVIRGETGHVANYNGYYMSQYYWAEETIPIIENKIKHMLR